MVSVASLPLKLPYNGCDGHSPYHNADNKPLCILWITVAASGSQLICNPPRMSLRQSSTAHYQALYAVIRLYWLVSFYLCFTKWIINFQVLLLAKKAFLYHQCSVIVQKTEGLLCYTIHFVSY